MKVFPAIDLCDGKVVRLFKGDYGKVTVYNEDAVSVAKSFYDQGARYLHIVDLDGAKKGETSNFKLIEQIVAATGMYCEVGGGIRSMQSIETYLNHGAQRVILGTAAINNPQLLCEAVNKYGAKIAVGVDTKDGFVAVNGWTETTNIKGIDFCKDLKRLGVKHAIYTDISKDGTLKGTNLCLYKELAEIEGLTVTASGGVTFISEILQLNEYGTDSVILGKAIYEGVLNLADVIKSLGGVQ